MVEEKIRLQGRENRNIKRVPVSYATKKPIKRSGAVGGGWMGFEKLVGPSLIW